MRELRAPKGVFAVLGNHEYYAGRDRSRALLRNAGFTVLDNAAEELHPGLFLAGVPDARGSAQTGAAEADLGAALGGVGEDAAVVLLQHAPEAEKAAAEARVSPETVSEAEHTPSIMTRILEALARNPTMPAAAWADPIPVMTPRQGARP